MPPLVPRGRDLYLLLLGRQPSGRGWQGTGSVVMPFTEEEVQTGSGPAPSHGQ